jgi:hypothetical protein
MVCDCSGMKAQLDLKSSRDHYSYIINGQRLYIWSGEVSFLALGRNMV